MVQREDFVEILEAMDGLPVTVRLLDPPLHEFLPSTHELAVKEATVGLDRRGAPALRRRPVWQEANPMLGTRGVRLGVIKPGPLRHAGAGPHGGGPPAGGRRRAPDRRDHDPPHRQPRGAGPGPQWVEQAVATVAAERGPPARRAGPRRRQGRAGPR